MISLVLFPKPRNQAKAELGLLVILWTLIERMPGMRLGAKGLSTKLRFDYNSCVYTSSTNTLFFSFVFVLFCFVLFF